MTSIIIFIILSSAAQAHKVYIKSIEDLAKESHSIYSAKIQNINIQKQRCETSITAKFKLIRKQYGATIHAKKISFNKTIYYWRKAKYFWQKDCPSVHYYASPSPSPQQMIKGQIFLIFIIKKNSKKQSSTPSSAEYRISAVFPISNLSKIQKIMDTK